MSCKKYSIRIRGHCVMGSNCCLQTCRAARLDHKSQATVKAIGVKVALWLHKRASGIVYFYLYLNLTILFDLRV